MGGPGEIWGEREREGVVPRGFPLYPAVEFPLQLLRKEDQYLRTYVKSLLGPHGGWGALSPVCQSHCVPQFLHL